LSRAIRAQDIGEEIADLGLAKRSSTARRSAFGVAALRGRRKEKRGGNDAPWKDVENSKNKSEFPTLSTGLGNPAKNKNAGFPHFHHAGDGSISRPKDKNMKRKLNSS
jgi:hypothetical protein